MKIISLTLLLGFSTTFFAQNNYWQQEVNYQIQVKLDDQKHTLSGFESFEYINHSPNTLNEIYIHVWANAYASKKSALGKQLYRNGETSLQFAKEDDKGYMDSLDFRVNGQKLDWEFDPKHQDILKLYLKNPLVSGASITITTPFFVKIPSGEISRLGHIGQSYQITQWYPKPAVYDKNGWNPIPYLNQGEFYSEYGSFDVSITLPQNYVVGATGDLKTESEMAFLNQRNQETIAAFQSGKFDQRKSFSKSKRDEFPASSQEWKTIRFTQSNVHDFAWFADKRYEVLKGEVTLPNSNRKVTTWAMFTPKNANLWKNASEYLHDGTYYYSKWNGDYPYNQVTAVDGTISAGGGMEYPNVTVIGNANSAEELEVVIVHEVGHNWFYGILGSNERIHGWMDEGLNTLNEMRYIQSKYPNNQRLSDMVMGGSFHFDHLNHHDMGDISYRFTASLGDDQPIETSSEHFTSMNYGIIMYQKTGLVFFYLKDYLGEAKFDQAMQSYFEQWKFKHPEPKDLQQTLEQSSNRNLNWLFYDLIQTTNHVDYKISKLKRDGNNYELTIKNKGQVNGPIRIDGFKEGKLMDSIWIEPSDLRKEKVSFQGDYDFFIIDEGKNIPEMNRSNNWIKTHGAFKKMEPLTLEFLIGDNESKKTNLFWTPIMAGNAYDKFMLGVAIHNNGIPFKPFQYLIAPMYSFGRQMVSGIGEFSYTFLPKQNVKLSRFGVSIKSFKNDNFYKRNDSYFYALSPYWFAKLGQRKDHKPFSHQLLVQSLYRYDQWGAQKTEHAGGYVNYTMQWEYPDHKVQWDVRTDFLAEVNRDNQIGRSHVTGQYQYRYLKNKMKRWIELRVFAGGYWLTHFYSKANTYSYAMSLSGTSGTQDWFAEDYFFGRNQVHGIWSQQRMENNGGFKSTNDYGTTLNWMSSANIYFQIPIKPGIFGLYSDFGAFYNGTVVNTAINTGAAIRFGKVFGLYFPIWMSKSMEDAYLTKKYGERIRFTLKLNLVNKPFKLSNFL